MPTNHLENFARQIAGKLGQHVIIAISPVLSKKVRYRGWLGTKLTWVLFKSRVRKEG